MKSPDTWPDDIVRFLTTNSTRKKRTNTKPTSVALRKERQPPSCKLKRIYRMKRSLIVLGYLLLAGPALAQSVGEKTGVNSTLGISPTTADFVKEVAISDMFEIQSNTLAQDKGNASEKSFASQMVTDHTKTR